jgi:arylsulfatase A-like enzyme
MNRQQMWGLMLLTGVALYLWQSGDTTPLRSTRTKGPNVLLITLDTTRADAIGPKSTPAIERMAREGARFSTAVSSAPITQPAHLGMLTGEPPYVSGVVTNGTHIGDRPTALPIALSAAGYVTSAFVSATPLTSKFGWDQGWDHFDDRLRVGLLDSSKERTASHTVDAALAWLEHHRDQRFATWVHLFDAHGPYEAPGRIIDGPTDGEALALPGYWPDAHKAITDPGWFVAAYAAEIHHMDQQLERLFVALAEWGVLDDTLVIIVGDHGESLTEHGYLFDHGDHMYDVSLRVPLIVRWPEHIEAGVGHDCVVSTTGVYSAVLDLTGIRGPEHTMNSQLSGVLSRGTPCVDEFVLASTVTARFTDPPPIEHALRTRAVKRVLPAEGEPYCFDLILDPNELRPTPECGADVTKAMVEMLRTKRPPVPPNRDAQTKEQLIELGYLE